MADSGEAPRSPNYGGRLGYGIFQWIIRLLGVTPAYLLLLLVVPYYALVRASARRCAAPYLRRRFPEYGACRRFLAAIEHFYRFGQALIDQGAMGILGPEAFRIEFPGEKGLHDLAQKGKGLVLLTSHVGNWQTAMADMGRLGVPVHFQLRLEEHTQGRHFFDLARRQGEFRVIPPNGFLGGMVEMTNALRAGECVAIMGDRSWGARTARADFLGAPAAFPITPYRLAVSTGADLVVLLTARTGKLAYTLQSVPITEGRDWSAIPREEAIAELLDRYVQCLEKHVDAHPFMWFNFFDFWAEDKGTSAP